MFVRYQTSDQCAFVGGIVSALSSGCVEEEGERERKRERESILHPSPGERKRV